MFDNFGKTLAFLRDLRGKLQVDVARGAGVGKSQISKYESGKELPKLETLERLLVSLGIGYFEFFYTLYVVDQKIAALKADEPSAAWRVSNQAMGPELDQRFRALAGDLMILQGEVVRLALLRATGKGLGQEVTGRRRREPSDD